MNPMNFLKYFPALYKPRKNQHRVLVKDLPQVWDEYQIIVIEAPVAFGKSPLAKTIAEAASRERHQTTAKCVPTVIHQNQYQKEFPDLPLLKGAARYSCHDQKYSSCDAKKTAENGKTCPNCPYKQDVKDCSRSDIAIFNLYSYLFLRDVHKNIVILDEAQAIISQLRELYTIKFWAHKDQYPKDLTTQGDVLEWLETKVAEYDEQIASIKNTKKHDELIKLKNKLDKMIQGMKRYPGSFYYEYKKDYYYGAKRDALLITPYTMKGLIHKLGSAKKLVLLSATINEFDLEELGLNDKKVAFVKADSEIPVQNRPILFLPAYKASYKNNGIYEPVLAKTLKKLIKKHKGKGFIHVTYDMIDRIKPFLVDESRIIWHNRMNKEAKFKEFLKSDDKIFIAAGMAEGIDLAGKEYEWQVITKIVYPSLADGLVKRQKAANPKWYTWQACKTLIQQSGRICRTPTDYGITYILDTNFIMLYHGMGKDMFPDYFKQAEQYGKLLIKKDYKGFLKDGEEKT